MAALIQDRTTARRAGNQYSDLLAANTVIYAGAMYALDDTGNAKPATADGGRARAVAQARADQARGDEFVHGETGVFLFGNSAADKEITRADIGKNAFIADDQTVAKTGNASAIAGVVVDVDDDGVWVRVGV